MGRKYGIITGGGRKYGGGTSEVEQLETLTKEAGLKVPTTRRPGTLSRLFGFLTAAETAPAAYKLLETRRPEEAAKTYVSEFAKGVILKGLPPEKKTYADVLKMVGVPEMKIAGPVTGRGIAGLALDIALDPTTYIGAGLVKQAGRGIKFLSAPARKTKVYQETVYLLGKLFKPGYEVKKMGKVGEEYLTSVNKLLKGTRGEAREAVEKIGKMAGEAEAIYGKGTGEMISELIEKPTREVVEKVPKVVDSLQEIADIIRKGHREFAKAEKAKGILKTELPDYLRHYLTPEGREFIETGGREITAEFMKPLRVRLQAAKPRKLQGTIKEINEYFQKEHGLKLFEPDAFKAFAGRTVENIKAVRMYDFLRETGEKFGIRAPEGVEKTIKEGMVYTRSTAPQLKGFLLPEPIASHIDETRKILTNDQATNEILRLYDRALGFWKGTVTGIWPAFHGRNFMGGVFNNWIAGLKNPQRYLEGHKIATGQVGEIITKTGKKISYDDVRKMAGELGVRGQPGYLDVMRTMEEIARPKKGVMKLLDYPRRGMEFVEDRLRIPLFIDELVKGKTPQEAAKSVFKFHFDYTPEGLAPFEKNIMKRIIPFYTWTRNNIPLQFEQMAKQPAKYASVAKLFRSLRGERGKEEFQYLPQYMKEYFPIKLGEKKGIGEWLYGLGLPIEDIGETIGETPSRTLEKILAKAAPPLKVPLELATERHFFFGKPLGEVDYVYPEIAKIPGMKQVLGLVEKKSKKGRTYYVTTKPELLHIANSILGRAYTTTGKLTSEDMSGMLKVLYAIMGARGRQVDIEREKQFREIEQSKELQKFLEKYGLLKKFERYYQPKR